MNNNFKYRVFFPVQSKRANLVSKETKKVFKKSLDYFILHFNDIDKKYFVKFQEYANSN